jgi:hypothetical protein
LGGFAQEQSMLKIRYKLLKKYQAKQRRKPIRHGYCKICGSKLSDEHSIERGIGKGCLSKNVAIILEIIPDAPSNNA